MIPEITANIARGLWIKHIKIVGSRASGLHGHVLYTLRFPDGTEIVRTIHGIKALLNEDSNHENR